MADPTTTDQLRIAHRRGHSLPLHERAREDVARADTLVANNAVVEVGDLYDGEMLVVDGDQIVTAPVPSGSTVTVGAGLEGDGSVGDPITVVFGTTHNQVRHADDAAYTDARTPLAHTQAIGTITGLGTGVATFLATPSSANLAASLTDETGTGAAVFANSPTLVTPNLGTPASGNLSNCTALNATQLTSGTVQIARVTTATANQPLKVDSAGTSIVGGKALQEAYMSADQTITTGAGNTTLTMDAALTITSGKKYRYQIEIYCIGATGTPTFVCGAFTTANGAGVSVHNRGVARVNSNTYGSSTSNAADITTALTGQGTSSATVSIFVVRGVLTCNATGSITPVVSCTTNNVSVLAGTNFELKQLD